MTIYGVWEVYDNGEDWEDNCHFESFVLDENKVARFFTTKEEAFKFLLNNADKVKKQHAKNKKANTSVDEDKITASLIIHRSFGIEKYWWTIREAVLITEDSK